MTVWLKRGVIGDLCIQAQKGFGRVANLYEDEGKDIYCTSIRDGNHSPGSMHYIGQAFDIKPMGVSVGKIRAALGNDFDVVDEFNHIHVEFDPK